MSEVLSIRISRELKEAMKKIDIDWRKEIEDFIRARIRQYLKNFYLERARMHRNRFPKVNFTQAEWIREDRDAR